MVVYHGISDIDNRCHIDSTRLRLEFPYFNHFQDTTLKNLKNTEPGAEICLFSMDFLMVTGAEKDQQERTRAHLTLKQVTRASGNCEELNFQDNQGQLQLQNMYINSLTY